MEKAPISNLHQRMRREHDELRSLLGRVTRCISEQGDPEIGIRELLAELTGHVQQHFVDEETDGLFERIVSQAPWLAERADDLRTEHRQLLTVLTEVNDSLDLELPDDERWSRLDSQFHRFSQQLMQHESKENDLLLEAYEQDIGSKD